MIRILLIFIMHVWLFINKDFISFRLGEEEIPHTLHIFYFLQFFTLKNDRYGGVVRTVCICAGVVYVKRKIERKEREE